MTDLLRAARRIRTIEETLATHYPEGKMRTPTHFSIGQEAVAVGVCSALRPDDVVTASHRCHAAYLAKGGNLDAMVAELYGKATGCCGGWGGSVHLRDPSVGFLGAAPLLGQMIPVAVGAAWAFKLAGSDRVAVTFFGDGAVEEGIWYESLNFAAVHQLPVLFVCENNGLSTHTPINVRQPWDLSQDRAKEILGLKGETAFTHLNEPRDIATLAGWLVEVLRGGNGPCYLECPTMRYREHVGPGPNDSVSPEVLAQELARDCLRDIPEDPADVAEIAAAMAAAEAGPWPEATW